jgi:hypothetical protein
VPDPAGGPPAPGSTFSFNDPTKPQILDPDADSPPSPLSEQNRPVDNPDPVQVVRVMPVHPSTRATNDHYREALAGTVWANYRLVVTQWPTQTKDPSKPFPEDILGNPFPPNSSSTSIANTTMETYFQDRASCMICHEPARLRKTDFVWFVNVRAFPPSEPAFNAIAHELDTLRKTKLREKQ